MTTAFGLGIGIRKVAARLAPDSTHDGELLSRFLTSRDEAAFAALVRRHGRMVLGTCRRVLGNAADADDAFQAAFVVLVRKAHTLTDRVCVGNFLYGIAFHTALKAKSMAVKRRAKEAKVQSPISAPADRELTELFDEELAKLGEKYRGPVVLCDLEGVGRKDAAIRLGIPEGTISSRLATAHRMLEKRLRLRGFAAVGLTAVLGNGALAVSESLADAAVQAAVAGPSPAVTQLATEVTKMFLLNKILVGTAILAGVVLMLGVGVGAAQPGHTADARVSIRAPIPKKVDDKKLLLGKWVTKSVTFDPPMPVPQNATHYPAHHELTFTDTDLNWVSFDSSPPQPNVVQARSEQTKPYTLNQTGKPKELMSGDNDCIYELDGDTLKVAMNALCPGRPKAFNAKDSPPGPNGHVWVIELVREKEKPKGEVEPKKE